MALTAMRFIKCYSFFAFNKSYSSRAEWELNGFSDRSSLYETPAIKQDETIRVIQFINDITLYLNFIMSNTESLFCLDILLKTKTSYS